MDDKTLNIDERIERLEDQVEELEARNRRLRDLAIQEELTMSEWMVILDLATVWSPLDMPSIMDKKSNGHMHTDAFYDQVNSLFKKALSKIDAEGSYDSNSRYATDSID
jgi:hypothetical protein|tara:strand:+ start:121 stop:447 length:327 start_codon:yes stop_codon:yes gene_type:complete